MEYTLDNTEKSREKRVNSMAETELRIRRATLADAESILDIYRPYVEETVITFEYLVPGLESFGAHRPYP